MLGWVGLTVESISAASGIALAIVPVPSQFCSLLHDRQEVGIFDV